MAEHRAAPYTEMHRPVWNGPNAAGPMASRPASPEGTGDTYLSTDDSTLSICFDTTGPFTWTEFPLDNINNPSETPRYIGKFLVDADQPVATATPYNVQFDGYLFEDSPYYSTGFGDTFQPIGEDVYEVSFHLMFEDTTPTEWLIEVQLNGVTNPGDSIVFNTAGGKSFHYRTMIYMPTNPDITIQVTQSSGGSLDVLEGGWIAFNRINNP